MTTQRRDEHSTEFGIWLRKQEDIDSKDGYIATNIDYMWKNYKTLEWMLIEEKRYKSCVKTWQSSMFKQLDTALKTDPNYKGFHVVIFEKTSPEDGDIYLDGEKVTKLQLTKFLQFNPNWRG